jgi:repressor LexA
MGKTTNSLTSRQSEVLAFVMKRQRLSGCCPSQREIADHFGFKSTFAVREHLRLIERKGLLKRTPGRRRHIQVKQHVRGFSDEVVDVPLVGRIAAGVPVTAIENLELLLPLPRSCFRGRNLFALRVRGDSMRDAGILSGDLAVLDQNAKVEHGQIAAVLLDEDATLKRFLRKHDSLVLRAANPAFPDIVIRVDEEGSLRVAGLLVGLVRSA